MNTGRVIAIKGHMLGTSKNVTLDEYLPYFLNHDSNNNPYWHSLGSYPVARPGGVYDFWVNYMEKAWAKVVGNLQRTQYGKAGQALRFLTNAPYTTTTSFAWYTSSAIYNQIKTEKALKSLIVAETFQSIHGETHDQIGLPLNSPYSILDVQQITASNCQTVHYIYKMRDPRATDYTYNGTWSDTSNIWNTLGC
jgi:hypothetical protein